MLPALPMSGSLLYEEEGTSFLYMSERIVEPERSREITKVMCILTGATYSAMDHILIEPVPASLNVTKK